jgi:hypothetical protein
LISKQGSALDWEELLGSPVASEWIGAIDNGALSIEQFLASHWRQSFEKEEGIGSKESRYGEPDELAVGTMATP